MDFFIILNRFFSLIIIKLILMEMILNHACSTRHKLVLVQVYESVCVHIKML